jgi:hypothetical protein
MRLYGIIRKVKEEKHVSDQRLFNSKRKVRDKTFITKVASDKGGAIRKPAQPHGVSTKKIYATLHENLSLSKKSASWVPNLLNEEMQGLLGDGPMPFRGRRVILISRGKHTRAQLSERALMVSGGTVEGDKWPRGEVVFFYS